VPPYIRTINESDVLYAGLSYVGFDLRRQQKVNLYRNVERFKAHYGVGPRTVVPFFGDLRDKFPEIIFKDSLLTMNWLKAYDVQPVLAGRWGYCEEYIGAKVKECGKQMQSLKDTKIRFELDDDEIFFSLDTVNYLVQEMRQDPSSKWYDHKSHSCGLVS